MAMSHLLTMQTTVAPGVRYATTHPVDIDIQPALTDRNRLTVAFRVLLALPHVLLVGGPIALCMSLASRADASPHFELGGGGVLGAVAAVAALIAWFAIVFGGRYPEGLRKLAVLYLRWRVRAIAYLTLLRDEYPPFEDAAYPAEVHLPADRDTRDRLTVAFRIVLALPHIVMVWILGAAWAVTSVIAWFAILITGRYPEPLYEFAVGVFRWSTRVEAYLLLLHDDYPPFALH